MDWKINFWKINDNLNQTSNGNNFSLNEKIQAEPTQEINNIQLDKIQVKEDKKLEPKKIEFWSDNKENKQKKHYHINYRKIFILSFITILISNLISLWLYFYNDYIINYKNTDTQSALIKTIETVSDYIQDITKTHQAADTINLIWNNWENELKKFINWDINYIKKKNTLTNSIKQLSNNIIDNHKTLDNIKKEITKNWFLSTDISNILNDDDQIWSIQNSLISLEAIKFNSAINVFSYLDTFIESLSNSLEIEKSSIEQKTKEIISRWEKDINLYIRNCYLNPFEVNYKCNIVWDFDKYYQLNKEDGFDRNFFKELINYTDNKLEQTELPSFSITFQKFDQNKDEITFKIDVNTFKQDELELAKKWILSPHIFIFTNLINNLKQSKFIIWEGISTKNIDIQNKVIEIWSTQFMVHNSSNTFTLPIQKETAREISDFVDIKK